MQREVFVVEKERFDLSDEKIYHLQGTWPKEHTAAAELDGKPLEVNLKQQERISALERFQDLDLVDAIRVQMEIVLPDKLEQYKKLVVSLMPMASSNKLKQQLPAQNAPATAILSYLF